MSAIIAVFIPGEGLSSASSAAPAKQANSEAIDALWTAIGAARAKGSKDRSYNFFHCLNGALKDATGRGIDFRGVCWQWFVDDMGPSEFESVAAAFVQRMLGMARH